MVSFQDDIEQCLKVLKIGGLILYPTDTIWGIGCDATNRQAVEKIFSLKQRADEKSMIVLVAEEGDIIRHVAAPDMQVFDWLQQVTRPTTVIYEHALGLAENLLAPDGSIGIRIVRDEFCRHLIKRFRKPLVSTSANISGQPGPRNFTEISEDICKGVDHIVKHRQSESLLSNPSVIIKWSGGKPEVIRS